jgi:glycerophosphoryl diester phosphodiesterase
LFQAVPRNWRVIAERLSGTTINADHERLRPPVVAEIRSAGYPLLAYTVNDPERARILFDWGVTSVFSDVPQRLHEFAGGSRQPSSADRVSAETPRQGSVQ